MRDKHSAYSDTNVGSVVQTVANPGISGCRFRFVQEEIGEDYCAEKIVVNGGFDNGGNVDAGIRAVVNNYVRQGLDLQAMVDAANRSFESNRQQYYLGVGEGNQLVLYYDRGPRLLPLR